MQSRFSPAIVALSLFAFVACSSDDSKNDDNQGGEYKPAATDVGSPTGGAASALIIGPAGGNVVSSDGRLSLTVPAGALATDTNVSITPISNKAHGGVGTAYRMEPDGQTFATAASLTFSFTDDDLKGSAPEFLGAAFQTDDGFWSWLDAPVVNASARTVTVATTHFTDFSVVQGLQIQPFQTNVKVRDRVTLRVVACYPVFIKDVDGEELQALAQDCGEGSDNLASPMIVTDWSVNGATGGSSTTGTVAGNGVTAVYTAPNAKPASNPVAVSARASNGASSYTVVSNITVQDDAPGYSGDVTWSLGTVFSGGSATVVFEQAKTFQFSVAYRGSGTISATYTAEYCTPVQVDAPLVTDPDPNDFDDGTFLEVVNADAPVFPASFSFNLKGVPQTKTFTCGLNTINPYSVTQDIELVIPVTFCSNTGYPTYTNASVISGTQNCADINSSVTFSFARQ